MMISCSECKYFKPKRIEGHNYGLCLQENTKVTSVQVACGQFVYRNALDAKKTEKCGCDD